MRILSIAVCLGALALGCKTPSPAPDIAPPVPPRLTRAQAENAAAVSRAAVLNHYPEGAFPSQDFRVRTAASVDGVVTAYGKTRFFTTYLDDSGTVTYVIIR